MSDTTFSFRLSGVRYDIDFNDFTAQDAGDFNKMVGYPMADVMSGRVTPDLPFYVGCAWLVQRRVKKGLPYQKLAHETTYGDLDVVEDDEEAPEPDPNSPEA